MTARPIAGMQQPRFLSIPPSVSSAGREATELAAEAGLLLDPWQQIVLDHALGEQPDGKWSAFEVGVIVARQNGKGSILEARELAGLFLFGEQLILHSAHLFKTAAEAFLRVRALIENTDSLRRRVKQIRTSHGEEQIELTSGQRLRFLARTGGSGRGLSGDCLIMDEAFNLPDGAMSALLPTLSARPNPQVWYTSSAGDVNQAGHLPEVLARIRQRGMRGGDPALAFLEWSAEERDDPTDPATWAKANPGLGIRISVEHVGREMAAMSPDTFAVERLSIGRYPMLDGESQVIPKDAWVSIADPESSPRDPVAFAVDVTPDRSMAAIGTAGHRVDGLRHLEVVEHRRGTHWLLGRLVELNEKWRPCAVVIDPGSGGGSLIPALQEKGIEPLLVSSSEYAQACGALFDAVTDPIPNLRHLDQPMLNAAVKGATKRPLRDAWAWDRKGETDISPLVAATLALHGLAVAAKPEPVKVPNLW